MKKTLLTLRIALFIIFVFCSFSIFSQCSIDFVTAEITACEGDAFDVSINFEYDNVSDQFTIVGNGNNYGTFNYNDVPVTITTLQADCITEYEFVVADVNNNNCSDFVEWGVVCCEEQCVLSDLILTPSECADDGFFLTIDFDYQWNTSATFEWNVVDISSGTAFFADLPLTVQVFDVNPDIEIIGFIANETGNPACAVETGFDNPCIDSSCEIGQISVDVEDCVNGEFAVLINFQYDNTSDQFTVVGNGTNYGTFGYANFPIIIEDLEGDCVTEFEFIITDVDNNNCTNFAGLDPVCCEGDCEIVSIDFGDNPICVDGFIVTEWLIFSENSSEVGFDIYINNEFLLFVEYDESQWYDFDIPDPGTDWFTIKACDNDNSACCYTWEVPNPCFAPEECFIGDIDIEVSECQGNQFFVVIDFEYENTSNEFFVNGDGGTYGPYQYASLPVTIQGLEANCDIAYEFQVYDSENNGTCTSVIFIGEVCCEEDCEMTTLDFGANPSCEDGLIVTSWLIDGVNISEVGFDIFINNEFQVFVEYNDSHWYDFDIEDPGTEFFTIKVCDNDNEECCIDWELTNPCFSDDPCELLDLIVETSECDGGEFGVTFDFDYSGNSSDPFDWEIPGYSSGVAEYGDLPLTIGIENTNMNGFDLFIYDSENFNCTVQGSFENPCFDGNDCFIGELNVDVSECQGNHFFVVIDFEYENTSDQFTVNGNGNNYGTFLYSDLPITIDGIESNCDLQYEFVVHDVNDNDCVSDVGIGSVCCEEDCEMTTLDFGANPSCEDGLIVTTWLIDGVNISEVGFDIFINDEFQVFVEYNDSHWYDFDIEDPGTEFFTIKVCDNDDEDCCIDWELTNPCFDGDPCELLDLIVETSECDGGEFGVTFDFDYTGNSSDSFDWEIMGYSSGVAEYGDLPLTIGIENTNMNGFDLIINDSENLNCIIQGSFENPCFDSNDCFIGELNVDVSECQGNQFFVVIDFEYENTSDEFFVNGDGGTYGPYQYANLPIVIQGLEANCDVSFEFQVYDSVNNGTCTSEINVGEVCCEEGECEIVSIDFGPIPICEEGFIVTEWLILGENTSEVGYDIFINNDFLLFVEYDDSDWYDFDIEAPGTEYFTIMACDNDNADCCYTWEVMNPCFEEEECDLFELDFDVSECDGDFFVVQIDFEYVGNSNETFVWEIPDVGSGSDLFANLPITIEIENTSESQFTFFASEDDNPECDIVGTFGNPCFNSEECNISNVTAEIIECEEDVFDVEINFEYENVGNTFAIQGNGVSYGTFEYADLPISLTSLSADCELEYEFVVVDEVNEQCTDFVEIGTICCEDFNQIEGVEATIILDGDSFSITYFVTTTNFKDCDTDVYVDGVLYVTLEVNESSFDLGPFDCSADDVMEIRFVNTCTDQEDIILLDLAEINCVTDVEVTLSNIDIQWDMMQKTLLLDGEISTTLDVQLINAQGALIFSENSVSNGWSKSLETLPSGLYFLRAVDNSSIAKNGLIKKILIY